MAKNYYDILGIKKTATADEIKSAYRKLAKKYHPDMFTNASDAEKKEAEVKFKEVNHAYEVLSDDQKRKVYDTYGDENGPQPGAGFGGFSQTFPLLLKLALRFLAHKLVRVKHYLAGRPVNHRLRSLLDLIQIKGHPDQRRDVHHARKNRRV